MRYLLLCGLLAGISAGGSAQPPRTPNGMLWAGTTFNLRAIATNDAGQTLAVSSPSVLSVGALVNWRVAHETENTLTVSGSESWFTFVVSNQGNVVDSLSLRLKSNESSDASPWSLTLFQEREDGSGFSNGQLLSDALDALAPGERRRLYLRARPPSNRLTDGAFVQWLGISQLAPTQVHILEFALGAEASQSVHTSATTWRNHTLIGDPILWERRLYWLTWDQLHLRVFRTPNPLNADTTFSNNTSFEARMSMSTPTQNTVLIGDRWYILTESGQIVFFLLTQAQGGATLPSTPIQLPEGVVPEPSLPLTRWGARLCFADRQGRLWVYNPVDATCVQWSLASAQPITALSPLSDTLLAVGYADGRVSVYQDAQLVLSGLRLPGASRQSVHALSLQGEQLIVAAGTRIGGYHFGLRKWQWVYELESPPVAQPVYNARRGVCYILTQNGWLHAVSYLRGLSLPLYPHRLFSEQPLTRAALACLTRADREVEYLYLQAQLSDGASRALIITGGNPLNRFVNTQLPANAPIGARWLFTDNTSQDLGLCWFVSGAGSDSTRGAFYGFRLR
ncbi:MAG: hypothetical protein KatS3mg020_0229 [Fimbriimonadales bacterium]|nr:MAG: hypothetical protein KatS3mg020_0229 [Fimbriimonadales bacterium]